MPVGRGKGPVGRGKGPVGGGLARARTRARSEARVGIRPWMRSPGRVCTRSGVARGGVARGKLESQDGHRHPFW